MCSKPYFRPALAALLVAGLVTGLVWLSVQRGDRFGQRQGATPQVTVLADVALPSPLSLSPSPNWSPAKQGQIVEQRRLPGNAAGQVHEISVYQTDFKHPLVRVERLLKMLPSGQEEVLNSVSMVADHLMVKRLPDVTEEAFEVRLRILSATIRRRLPGTPLYLVAPAEPTVAALDLLQQRLNEASDLLAYAEPDFIVHHHQPPVFPDDPSFAQQWHLHNTGQSGGLPDADIDAPEAWAVTTGSAAVVVGVIDTGLDLTHPDLLANLWINPGESGDGKESDGIDNDGNGYIDDVYGWNFVTQTAVPQDDHGHGTHTGGTVGAVGGNGVGVSGVCQTVRLMGLKFLSATGSGTTSDAIEAIRYATQMGAALTSNSWGGAGFSQALLDAIEEADAAGVGFVAAAGNSGINTDLYPEYPGSFQVPNVISVAATDSSDTLVWFSNYGQTTAHLAAAGLQTLSTGLGGSYVLNSGTSMAAPQVAGAAALLKAANPELSFAQIKAMLLDQVDPKPSLHNKTVTGGRLNVANAMVPATQPYVVVAEQVIEDVGTGNNDRIPSPGETVRLQVTLRNSGGYAAENVQATLSLPTALTGLRLLQTEASYGTLLPEVVAGNAGGGFEIEIDADVVPTDWPLRLDVTADEGQSWQFDLMLKIRTVATIAGVVTKTTGGEPLAAATLTLTGPETWTTETLADGSYSISVTNGTYQIQASAAGYLPSTLQTRTVPPSATNVNFALGYSEENISPPSLSAIQPEDSLTTQTLTLQNTGDQALTYLIQEIPPPPPGISALPVVTAQAPPAGETPRILTTAPNRTLPLPLLRGLDASDNTATSLPFRDGFEDGLWGRWWESWGNGTREVLSGLAPQGDKHFQFQFDGPADHFTGIHQIFPFGTQPGYISFWTQPGSPNEATSYMILLDLYLVFDSAGWRYEIADFIWFFANANGRFYLNDDVGGNQAVPYIEGQWYQVEFRNLDWQNKRFDYWVNGQLIQAAVPFRNPANASGIAYALTYNYSPNTTMGLDEAQFLPDELPWLHLSSKTGTVAPGASATITATFDSQALPAGHYPGTLKIITNDPRNPGTTLPVDMTVTPLPNEPPLAEAQTVALSYHTPQTLTLTGSDPDFDPLTWQIVGLPSQGTLYQTPDGTSLGDPFIHTPRTVTSPSQQVIFVPDPNTSGTPYASFDFIVRDPKLPSAPATVTLNVFDFPLLTVTPPGSSSDSPLSVQFSSSDPAAMIRFSTHGSDPTTAGHLVGNGSTLHVDHTLTLQVVATRDGRSSPVQTHTFTILDSDNDGLPDWWEMLHGQTTGGNLDPAADPDDDGLSNLQEFVLGTDPNRSDRLLPRVSTAQPPSIEWPSLPGRFYTVEACEDGKSFEPISPPRVGTGGLMSHSDEDAPPDRRIYRVSISLP